MRQPARELQASRGGFAGAVSVAAGRGDSCSCARGRLCKSARWQIRRCVGVQSPGEELAHLPAASALLRTGRRQGWAGGGGVGEAFGNPPRGGGVDVGTRRQGDGPAFGEVSPALRPWETPPAGSRCEGERCPVLESSVSRSPGAEIPSLPPGEGWSSPGVCQNWGAQSPALPSSQTLGLGSHPAAPAGLKWVKMLNVLQKRVFPFSPRAPRV